MSESGPSGESITSEGLEELRAEVEDLEGRGRNEKAERIKALTRFTSPLGVILFVGGIGTLAFLRLRGSQTARLSGSQHDDDSEKYDETEDREDQNDERIS